MSQGRQIQLLELKGWKAIALVLGLAAFAGYRAVAARTTLEEDARERIELHLQARYARDAMAEIDPEAFDGADAREVLRVTKVEVRSLKARGWGDEVVVRAEVRVDGGIPPDGEPITYWRMTHGSVTGWTVDREVGPFSWWLGWL